MGLWGLHEHGGSVRRRKPDTRRGADPALQPPWEVAHMSSKVPGTLLKTRRAFGARLTVVAVLAATMAMTLTGVAQANDKRDLKVMSQNMYLGASLEAATQAKTPEEFIVAVATIYGTVQFTNFPARAEAIAKEIATEQPDLIGLQEVSNWTATGPGAPPSLDFLAILQADLAKRHLSYAVASVSNNANIGPLPLALCSGELGSCTLTFQDRDVILVNKANRSLTVSNPKSGSYQTQEVLATPVGPLSFDRGWASIDATLSGKRFHYASTHLETEEYPSVQEAQGTEFLKGPAKSSGTVVAGGDFNSAADGSTTKTYANLTKFYFQDAWNTNPRRFPGFSCCQNPTLTNPTSQLASRIDLVLTHGAASATSAHLIGNTPFEAAPPFWPSDHAGLVASVHVY
jgi:endonuclease/exonuclease/phosphatase family metal-dependent hydrolase